MAKRSHWLSQGWVGLRLCADNCPMKGLSIWEQASMRYLVAFVLGGRPMNLDGFAFVDMVTGSHISFWVDRLGRSWLAPGPWSWGRMELSKGHLAFRKLTLKVD